ncbi:MAG: hypothetical protein QOD29_5986 [Alphaproteobacteria bacterium]|nr:hypothetical protein [Alphaproteobacteria bacterium]
MSFKPRVVLSWRIFNNSFNNLRRKRLSRKRFRFCIS